jgi:hypothetical protein
MESSSAAPRKRRLICAGPYVPSSKEKVMQVKDYYAAIMRFGAQQTLDRKANDASFMYEKELSTEVSASYDKPTPEQAQTFAHSYQQQLKHSPIAQHHVHHTSGKHGYEYVPSTQTVRFQLSEVLSLAAGCEFMQHVEFKPDADGITRLCSRSEEKSCSLVG